MSITLTGAYWYGNEASEYAKEHGYLDYKTFASAFSHVLNNSIIEAAAKHDIYFETVNGSEYDEETGNYTDVFQYYIVPEWTIDEIFSDTDEIIYYCEELDIYLWGVTHCGTAWDYVLTDIKINTGNK